MITTDRPAESLARTVLGIFKLRIGTLEAGHGWLPFWMARIDEHARTIR